MYQSLKLIKKFTLIRMYITLKKYKKLNSDIFRERLVYSFLSFLLTRNTFK